MNQPSRPQQPLSSYRRPAAARPAFRRSVAMCAATALAALSLAACATGYGGSAFVAPAREVGGALVTPAGMSLYVFDQDEAGAGKSRCNGPCATNWPPLAATPADAAEGPWSVIARDDGARQWAYQGRPLYLWAKDARPGDRTGDGVKGVWHLARP